MVQERGTPGDKKSKSHDLQKKRTALEHELELRSDLLALYHSTNLNNNSSVFPCFVRLIIPY